jgi:hypothetical protein
LSGTVSAQSFSGYKDFRFGMQRNEVITIVERICKGLPWDPNQKYDKGISGAIRGNWCYKIFGKNRHVYLDFYKTGELAQIQVEMDGLNLKKNDRNNIKTFVDHYYRVHELLKQKYELEIPLTNSLIQRFLEDGVNDIYEIYNDGKVVLKFTKRKVGYAFFKRIMVVYSTDNVGKYLTSLAKKSRSAKSDDF